MTRAFALAFLAALPLACSAQTPPAAASSPERAPGQPEPAADTAAAAPSTPTVPAPASSKITYTAANVNGKYIAMTYDDGPHASFTPRLLDILKERGIKATFYVVGKNVAEYPQIAKRIVDEGHEIGSHSWSHPQLNSMSDAAVRDQIERTERAIEKATGVKPTTFRPPYGAFTERQRRWAHGEFGYKVILWDLDPLDWKVRNAAHVEREILQKTKPGSIILTHDIHKTTVDAMPETLDTLLARGYQFVTVRDLIAMDRPTPPKPRATPAPTTTEATEQPAEAPAPATTTSEAPAATTPGAPASTTPARTSTGSRPPQTGAAPAQRGSTTVR